MIEERHTVVRKGEQIVVVRSPSTESTFEVSIPIPVEGHRGDLERVVHLASAFGRSPRRDKVSGIRTAWIEEGDGLLEYYTQHMVVVWVGRR